MKPGSRGTGRTASGVVAKRLSNSCQSTPVVATKNESWLPVKCKIGVRERGPFRDEN